MITYEIFLKRTFSLRKVAICFNYISPFQGFSLCFISKRRAAPCVCGNTLSGLQVIYIYSKLRFNSILTNGMGIVYIEIHDSQKVNPANVKTRY